MVWNRIKKAELIERLPQLTSLHAYEAAPHIEDSAVQQARHKAVQDQHDIAP